MSECHICLGAHDPEYHASALRIRRWLRGRLELAMRPIAIPPPKAGPHPPNMGNVKEMLCPAAERKKAARK